MICWHVLFSWAFREALSVCHLSHYVRPELLYKVIRKEIANFLRVIATEDFFVHPDTFISKDHLYEAISFFAGSWSEGWIEEKDGGTNLLDCGLSKAKLHTQELSHSWDPVELLFLVPALGKALFIEKSLQSISAPS